MRDRIESDLAQLSSGTLATISGFRSYSVLDDFQADLLGLYRVTTSCGKRFDSWVDFVNSFYGKHIIEAYQKYASDN